MGNPLNDADLERYRQEQRGELPYEDETCCPNCGETVYKYELQDCQLCGNDCCAECLSNGVCFECDKKRKMNNETNK